MLTAVLVLLGVFAVGLLVRSPALIGVACLASMLLPHPICLLLLLGMGVAVVVFIQSH